MGVDLLDIEVQGKSGITALIGPNGSGKTTLMRCIAGLARPRDGRIQLDDAVLCDVATGSWVPPERRNIGYLPQGDSLFPHLSALDNVAFGLRSRGIRKGEARHRAAAMLRDLDIAGLADRHPRRLSGGERQRVALARALILQPRLLLLDEPLAALDVRVQHELRSFLHARVADAGIPAIWITHDARDVRQVAARVVALAEGRVVQEGTPGELADNPADDFVSALLAS